MVPRPVLAVMMLFPIKEAVRVAAGPLSPCFLVEDARTFVQSEKHRDEEAERITASGQVVAPSLYYTKQSEAWLPKTLVADWSSFSFVPQLLAMRVVLLVSCTV
jgi:hypothetical protein